MFFIVPDVWLSRIALTNPRRALAATLPTLAGALAGGAVMYRWGARTEPSASAAELARIPAISPAMVARVEDDLAARGNLALVLGPTKGIPYKVYARTAGQTNRPLPEFLLWSVPARMIRFVLVTGGSGMVARAVRRRFPHITDPQGYAIHAAAWTAFYTWFFTSVGK